MNRINTLKANTKNKIKSYNMKHISGKQLDEYRSYTITLLNIFLPYILSYIENF